MIALLAAGCGRPTAPAGAAAASGPTVSPAGTPGSPPTSGETEAGKVTLSLNSRQYGVEDPLLVTIHNGLGTAISVRDQQSACTVIVLQRLEQGAWRAVGPSETLPDECGRF